MFKQAFPVTTRKPKVEFKYIDGDLTVRPWDGKEINVEAAQPIPRLEQDGDTLKIGHYRGDITVWVPQYRDIFSMTKIEVDKLNGRATIDGVGSVEMKEVRGPVTLTNIYGNVELEDIYEGAELATVGGNLKAKKAHSIRAGKISGNAELKRLDHVEIEVVSCNLEAKDIAKSIHCKQVSGNAEIDDCRNAEVSIENVGGNLEVDEAAKMLSSTAGDNMYVKSHFAPDSQVLLRAGGQMSIKMPDFASASVQVIHLGGFFGSSNLPPRAGNSGPFIYGGGQAKVELWVGGNLSLK